jgi:beta-glucosidase
MKGDKHFIFIIALIALISGACRNKNIQQNQEDYILERKVDSVLALMTLEEKIGQMSQLSGRWEFTGPVSDDHPYMDDVKNGRVGSMLNITGVKQTRELQRITLSETRLGIPLLFGYDIIHGYKTIFPVPLAEACSWDLDLIENSARIAAEEGTAAGIHWTFAPMVDIARDPRWGRIMEGAGEDPYLGALVARARVRGYQGDDLSNINTLAACAKHYAAYGAAEGGRDYNTTDMSERTLREIYLPPFKSATEEGVATFMKSFNELNGIPASANRMLDYILREEWGFKGMVVSDWNSVGELIPHGIARNKKEAAILAMRAGIDMDMQGNVYNEVLQELVENKIIPEKKIDESVRKILRLKFQLGLFDDPYRYCNEKREQELLLNHEYRLAARKAARESIVLLKNEGHLLPLDKNIRRLAIIGPLADNRYDILGEWRGRGEAKDAVSLLEGIKLKVDARTKIAYSEGCSISGEDRSGFKQAISIARKADAILLVVGESANMAGEGHSRSSLDLPGIQHELVKEIYNIGKPVIMILMNGRPLAIHWENEHLPAILETWQLGTEAGNAIADVIFGDYNPSGKLVVSFPHVTGQIPVYYNHKNTGRPGTNDYRFNSKYLDNPVEPLYPFGYGLSYTSFSYSNLRLSTDTISMKDTLEVRVTIKNTGKYSGEEIVQLYVRDLFGSVTRPVKELKDFRKIHLDPDEEQDIIFRIHTDMLKFYDIHMHRKAEPGHFHVMTGPNSAEYLQQEFILIH